MDGGPPAGGAAPGGVVPRPRGRRRAWLVATAVGLVLVLAGGGVAVAKVLQHRYQVPSADLFGDALASAGASASPPASPSPSPSPEPGAGIAGPLTILLVGVDTREGIPDWPPHADAVLVLQVSAGLDRACLFSLPRDLIVDIPAFPRAGFSGARTKLTHAMSEGARVPGTGVPDPAQGFQLLARTVSDYTGIRHFDAGAVLNFRGMTRLVDAVGGIDLYVDQRVRSIHLRPDGRGRIPDPDGDGYVGPAKVYEPGWQHLNGWQALDYARQRYLPGGDYSRQRHHQHLIRALVRTVQGLNLATDPVRLDGVLRAVGQSLIFDGRGRSVLDVGYALRRLPAEAITLVTLPGSSVGVGSGYRGERLDPVAGEFFAAVRADTVDAFLRTHPTLVNQDR